MAQTAQPASLKSRAMSGAIWISLETIGVQGMSFVVFAILAHYISPSDFGLMSISFSLIFSLKNLIIDNIVTAVTRKDDAADIEYTTAFWLTFGCGLFFCALLYGCANLAETVFHSPGLAAVLRPMSVISLFIGLSRTHEAWLTRHFQFRSMTVRALSGTLAGSILGIVMAMRGYGVTALIVQQVAASVVSTLLLWISCPWRPTLRLSMASVREIGHFMKTLVPTGFIYVVQQNSDTFLVAWFFGPASVGIYNVAKRVRFSLQMVAATPITGVAFSSLAELQNDPERLRRGLLLGVTVVCAVSGPVFFGASAIAHEAIVVVFGQKWADAAPVLALLSLGGLIMVLIGLNDNVFVTHKRQAWTFFISLAYSVLAIGAFALCTRLAVGSLALPFILPYLVTFPLSVALLCRLVKLRLAEWARAAFPGIGASLAMFAAIKLAETGLQGFGDGARLAILCPLGAAVYCAALWMFGRQAALTVIDVVRSVVQRRRRKQAASDQTAETAT